MEVAGVERDSGEERSNGIERQHAHKIELNMCDHVRVFGTILKAVRDFEDAQTLLIVEDRVAPAVYRPRIEIAVEAKVGLGQFLQTPRAAVVVRACKIPVNDVRKTLRSR